MYLVSFDSRASPCPTDGEFDTGWEVFSRDHLADNVGDKAAVAGPLMVLISLRRLRQAKATASTSTMARREGRGGEERGGEETGRGRGGA